MQHNAPQLIPEYHDARDPAQFGIRVPFVRPSMPRAAAVEADFAAASLGHSCAVTGNTCRITFTGVTVERNPFGLPPFTLPSPMDALPREARDALMSGGFQSGAFDTTFVDAETRVSRGDRGELRVFVKEA